MEREILFREWFDAERVISAELFHEINREVYWTLEGVKIGTLGRTTCVLGNKIYLIDPRFIDFAKTNRYYGNRFIPNNSQGGNYGKTGSYSARRIAF